jgi:hypothetical protein
MDYFLDITSFIDILYPPRTRHPDTFTTLFLFLESEEFISFFCNFVAEQELSNHDEA